MTKVFKCPGCSAPRVEVPHCDSKTCKWVKCHACKLVVEPATGRSFEPRPGGGMLA